VTNWLLMIYKIPQKPTAGRVYVWRKLKKLGAILLHDAAWVLPATDHTREQLRWLAAEVVEMKGEATVWEAKSILGADEGRLIGHFQKQVDTTYNQILGALKKKKVDLGAISRQYQQIQSQDYFKSELGRKAREAIISAKGVS
jgi:hypothetical protein